MAYMEFANKGEVDLNAFRLLGASSKREATDKIGFFGSGLKYATALMLRERIGFKVYAGKREVKFGLEKQKFNGIDFDVITIDGEKTSMTTQAGPDWEPWFAIREIYSNTIDEDGAMEIVTDIKPEKGTTKIYIEMGENLGDVTGNWQDYFSFKRESIADVIIANRFDEKRTYRIFAKRGIEYPVIFRRGIRVGELKSARSLFDYDFSHIEINESRVLKATYKAQVGMGEALMMTDNAEVIKTFIDNWQQKRIEYDETTWSYVLNDGFFGYSYGEVKARFTDEWLKQLKDKRIVPDQLTGFYGVTAKTVGFPMPLIKLLKKQFGDQLQFAGSNSKNAYKITGTPNDDYLRIHGILDKAGFSFPFERIKMGQFKDDDIHGQFDPEENLIILSETSEHWPKRSKTMLLLEELLHKKSGFSDNTREFQTFIIQELADKIDV